MPSEKAIIDSFKAHQGYLEFQETKDIKISELDFCLLIKVRQTASHILFNARFLELMYIFEEYEEGELVIFLEKLKSHFNYFFTPREEKSKI